MYGFTHSGLYRLPAQTRYGRYCAFSGSAERRLGACRGTGTLVCNVDGTDLSCDVTSAGATPTSEACDGADNDCDGHVDEPWDFGGFAGVREDLVGPVFGQLLGGRLCIGKLAEHDRIVNAFGATQVLTHVGGHRLRRRERRDVRRAREPPLAARRPTRPGGDGRGC